MNQNLQNPTKALMLTFLQTFGEECKNNIEFSEFSNETLFQVIQNNPELFSETIEGNLDLIDLETILFDLKNPLHDLINLRLTINRIADTDLDPEIKGKMLIALNSALWDEPKVIEELKGNTILFYYPDSIETQKYFNSDNSVGFDETEDDFEYYANKIYDKYNASTLKVASSDFRFFKVGDELLDKKEFDHPFGFILYKDNESKVYPGIFTDIGMQEIINEFFTKI